MQVAVQQCTCSSSQRLARQMCQQSGLVKPRGVGQQLPIHLECQSSTICTHCGLKPARSSAALSCCMSRRSAATRL
jgi:hypothetical protein